MVDSDGWYDDEHPYLERQSLDMRPRAPHDVYTRNGTIWGIVLSMDDCDRWYDDGYAVSWTAIPRYEVSSTYDVITIHY